ncbi:MAG: hypothetical protein E7329_01725 [Clostridiales bacterium]|nr:hypothetical protein [Clostridiales bacterium]
MIIHRLLAHNSREEAIPLKKTWTLLLLLTVAAALLTGCASNADTLASPTPGATQMLPQASPNATDGMMNGPANSIAPDASSAPTLGAGGITTLEDAKKASEEMEDALEKLTEVDDTHVVATGKNALVGLEFTAQYQGEVDDRLKKMVLSRVQTVDKTVTGVAVTADEKLVEEIDALAETLESATSLDAVATQADDLMNQISIYTE